MQSFFPQFFFFFLSTNLILNFLWNFSNRKKVNWKCLRPPNVTPRYLFYFVLPITQKLPQIKLVISFAIIRCKGQSSIMSKVMGVKISSWKRVMYILVNLSKYNTGDRLWLWPDLVYLKKKILKSTSDRFFFCPSRGSGRSWTNVEILIVLSIVVYN